MWIHKNVERTLELKHTNRNNRTNQWSMDVSISATQIGALGPDNGLTDSSFFLPVLCNKSWLLSLFLCTLIALSVTMYREGSRLFFAYWMLGVSQFQMVKTFNLVLSMQSRCRVTQEAKIVFVAWIEAKTCKKGLAPHWKQRTEPEMNNMSTASIAKRGNDKHCTIRLYSLLRAVTKLLMLTAITHLHQADSVPQNRTARNNSSNGGARCWW